MPARIRRIHRTLLACASVALLAAQAVQAIPVASGPASKEAGSLLLELAAPASAAAERAEPGTASGTAALNAISRGRWASACGTATKILAARIPDVDALGVFALCSAIDNDAAAAGSALERLHEAESPRYYGALTEGILDLRNGLPAQAETAFKTVLKAKSGDPLAAYFNGEALHAQRKDAEAIAAFRKVLKAWPDHAPALTAVARLLAGAKASRDNLQEALAMAERAAAVDPTNRAHWKLLAELCARTGQAGRANAISVQWLSGLPRIN
jgi:tetratricopeptide (TPR) repeat protein